VNANKRLPLYVVPHLTETELYAFKNKNNPSLSSLHRGRSVEMAESSCKITFTPNRTAATLTSTEQGAFTLEQELLSVDRNWLD